MVTVVVVDRLPRVMLPPVWATRAEDAPVVTFKTGVLDVTMPLFCAQIPYPAVPVADVVIVKEIGSVKVEEPPLTEICPVLVCACAVRPTGHVTIRLIATDTLNLRVALKCVDMT